MAKEKQEEALDVRAMVGVELDRIHRLIEGINPASKQGMTVRYKAEAFDRVCAAIQAEESGAKSKAAEKAA